MKATDITPSQRLHALSAVRAASAHSSSGDLDRILQKRLRFLTVVYFLVYLIQFAFDIVPGLVQQTAWPTGLLLFGRITVVLTFVTICSLLGIVWRWRDIPMGILRFLELVFFGTLFLRLAVSNVVGFWGGDDFGLVFQLLEEGGPSLARGNLRRMALAAIHSWEVSLIVYGIFIPNTWRRCTIVVGTAALTPAALWVAACASHQIPAGLLMQTLLANVMRPLAVGVAISIYGAYRIETLRQEVSAARRLGPYQLKEQLGTGGMGEVYLAEHLLLKRPCAVKLISPEQAGDARNLLRFEREVQATATLTHPNTVQVFDYGVTGEGIFYYAMEYLPGLNLNQFMLQCRSLPPGRVIYLLRQVCGALYEAHLIGLVHRDVKPGNILVCKLGARHDVVKLLDFGLVRGAALEDTDEKLTQEGTLAGTPDYMSPEQAAGEEKIDGRSDIYSLGAVAYFLLTGEPPFSRSTPMRTVSAHIHESAESISNRRSDVPQDLDEVVMRCLKKDPKLRFPDARALEQALDQCKDADAWSEEQAAAWWRAKRPND